MAVQMPKTRLSGVKEPAESRVFVVNFSLVHANEFLIEKRVI